MAGITDKHGETVTLHNFDQTGTDKYGDPIYSETTTEIKAIVDMTRTPSEQSDQSGTRPVADADIYVSDTVNVTDQSQSQRSSEITRNGRRYEVIYAFDEGNGYYKLSCEGR